MSEFDWNDRKDAVIIHQYGSIAIYKNADGDIVLQQQSTPLDDEDDFVIVPADMLERIIAALQALR